MSRGRPRKTIEEHLAAGTYRKKRHEQTAVDLEVAVEAVQPSPAVPLAVRAEWQIVTQRLVALGVLIDADIPLLESAFVLLADARYYHELLERVKTTLEDASEELEADAAGGAPMSVEARLAAVMAQSEAIKTMVSLNGMHTKALQLFSGIVSKFAISPSERAKILHALPKKKDDGPKKSIRSVLGPRKK